MTIFCISNSYLVEASTKGEGIKNTQKLITWFMDSPSASPCYHATLIIEIEDEKLKFRFIFE